MDIQKALVTMKTTRWGDDDRSIALDVLRSHEFSRAKVRARILRAPKRLEYLVDRIETGDDLRDDLPYTIRLYRLAVPEFATGVFWDSLRWGPSVHLDGLTTSAHTLWTATIKRDDPRLLAHVNAGEFIIEALTADEVRPA